MTYQVDILNPKASKLLQDLADMNLITIKKTVDDDFLLAVKNIRAKSSKSAPAIDTINDVVKEVRSKRYAKAKK